MWTEIGDVLPLATGLALSPFAVVTGIILLLGERGRTKTTVFALGWFAAILVIATVAAWLVTAADDASADATESGVDLLQLVFGALFAVLTVLTWRKRPRGDEPTENKLLRRLDDITVLGALGIGLAQGLLVIKNIPLAGGAGVQLGDGQLSTAQTAIALAVFAAVASAGVLVPLAVSTVGGERLEAPLRRTREWLEQNMSPVTATILALLAAYFLGQGLAILD